MWTLQPDIVELAGNWWSSFVVSSLPKSTVQVEIEVVKRET